MEKFRGYLIGAVLGIVLGLAVGYVFQLDRVRDEGMLPNFSMNDNILVNRIYYKNHLPKRGQVVMVADNMYEATGEDYIMIKRVIGLPGDTVSIVDGVVFINGEEIVEDYILTKASSGDFQPVTVGEGNVFLMGDNRQASTDSRHVSLGQVKINDILGKVIKEW